MRALPAALLALAWSAPLAAAQQLDARFSCSDKQEVAGEQLTFADHGRIRLSGDRIEAFRWESALYRSTHGFDCNIDEEDGLKAELTGQAAWRIELRDPLEARMRRGYDFARHMVCTVRLEREGDTVHIRPTCPALCGSRNNFSELSVNTKTGECQYQH
ncbi:MAG TPA: hypothetical protein VM406_03155 [Noviherbaspirillum sp.]|nr:hypothetical protein [Noviherbaspirillum sp.]